MMRIFNNLTVYPLLAVLLAGCSNIPRLDEVLPDKRTEYRNARELPPLEVPPDLTTNTINDSMAIPGEETPNTLSAYQKQQRQATSSSELGGPLANEDQLIVNGDRFSVWPELKRFWQERGFALELDDAELGVLETAWSEARETDNGEVRDKFKVFAEPGSAEDTTVLFIAHDLQRRSGAGGEWQDAGSSTEIRQAMAARMYEFFGGTPAAGNTQVAAAGGNASSGSMPESKQPTQPPSSGIRRAEIINNDQGQVYMTLPDHYDNAWSATESAMENAGIEVRSSDRDKGEFLVAYQPPQNAAGDGWFDALKFWENDEPAVYRLTLTSAEEGSELIVRDEEGAWLSTDAARQMLSRIQFQYNR